MTATDEDSDSEEDCFKYESLSKCKRRVDKNLPHFDVSQQKHESTCGKQSGKERSQGQGQGPSNNPRWHSKAKSPRPNDRSTFKMKSSVKAKDSSRLKRNSRKNHLPLLKVAMPFSSKSIKTRSDSADIKQELPSTENSPCPPKERNEKIVCELIEPNSVKTETQSTSQPVTQGVSKMVHGSCHSLSTPKKNCLPPNMKSPLNHNRAGVYFDSPICSSKEKLSVQTLSPLEQKPVGISYDEPTSSAKKTPCHETKSPLKQKPVGFSGNKTTNSAKKTPSPKTKSPLKQKPAGNCPICQMPFSVLGFADSPRWHVTECMDLPFKDQDECPDGMNCNNTIPGHYRRFRHTEMANNGAGISQEHEEKRLKSVARELEFENDSDSMKCEMRSISSEYISYGLGKHGDMDKLIVEKDIKDASLIMNDEPDCEMTYQSSNTIKNSPLLLDDKSNEKSMGATSSVMNITPKKSLGKSQSSILSFFESQNPQRLSNKQEKIICHSASVCTGTKEIQSPIKKPKLSDWGLKPFSTKIKPTASGNSSTNYLKADTKDSSIQGSNQGYIRSAYRNGRTCPFYKKIQGSTFTVDAFSYGEIPGCKYYFLSHFHYDHYQGLTRHFKQQIVCSQITANLVKKKIKVPEKYLISVALHNRTVLDGVGVTLLEANHCPGSVLFLFELPSGKKVLHTGDFRASKEMESYPELQNINIQTLYLDTTYCDPTYAFPPQDTVIAFTVSLVLNHLRLNPKVLVVVGSYTIGKERIFMAIAEALDCKICVTKEKKNILDCLENKSLDKRLTLDAGQAKLHVLPMKQLNTLKLSQYLTRFETKYDGIIAIEPTGWTHNSRSHGLNDLKPKARSKNIVIYGVPYSEHSSYTELQRFTQFLRAEKILPTVNNGSATQRGKMEAIFKKWRQ